MSDVKPQSGGVTPEVTPDPGPAQAPLGIADTVRVTLWFDTPLEDVRRHLGDDFKPQTGEGITVEACAAALVRNHHAKYGYIGWKVGA